MTPPTKWQHPTMGEVQFRDLRPAQAAAESDDEYVKAMSELDTAMSEAPDHEARHAAVALFYGFKVMQARADLPTDTTAGHVTFDFAAEQWDRTRLGEYAVCLLAGTVGEKAGPPAWPPRSDDGMASDRSDEKQLANIVDQLHLNQKQWNGLVDIARMVTEHPAIKRAEQYMSTMLGLGESLTAPMLKDLYRSAVEQTEETTATAPPTQEDVEHALLVHEMRAQMIAYLEDCNRYRERQDAKALRQRCDATAAEFGRNPNTPEGRGR